MGVRAALAVCALFSWAALVAAAPARAAGPPTLKIEIIGAGQVTGLGINCGLGALTCYTAYGTDPQGGLAHGHGGGRLGVQPLGGRRLGVRRGHELPDRRWGDRREDRHCRVHRRGRCRHQHVRGRADDRGNDRPRRGHDRLGELLDRLRTGSRDVDGMQFPFRLRHAVGADTIEETTFDRFKVNAKIDPKRFEVRK